MKNKIILPFLVFFAFCANAQEFNAINYSNGVPSSFNLYVPDLTTQILFNPARAAKSDQSFFYLTKNQEPTFYPVYLVSYYDNIIIESLRLSPPSYIEYLQPNNSSFSGGALFNSSFGKFLVQTNFQLKNNDNESESESTNPNYYSTDYYSERNSSSSNGDQNLSNLNFRIDKISGTEEGGFSIGLFGQLLPNESENNSVSTRERIQKNYFNQEINGYNSRQYQFQKSEYKSNSDGGFYSGGIEIGISTNSYDLTANVSVVFSKNNMKNIEYDYNNQFDSSYYSPNWQNYKRIQKNSNMRSESQDLTGFNGNIYYSSAANYFQDDDRYFAGVTYNYQSGDHKIKGDFLNEYVYKYSTSNYWYGDSTQFKFPDETSPTKNTFYGFQAGYKTGKTLDDIKVLVGLTYIFGFSKNEYTSYNLSGSYYSGNVNRYIREENFYMNSVLLPIFISYTPTSWFDLHGGLTYEVKQNSYSTEQTQNQTTYTNNNILQNTSSGKTKSKSSQTSQSLNSSLGATLKHSSGLKLYAAFNNDILAYKTWDLTLLYNF